MFLFIEQFGVGEEVLSLICGCFKVLFGCCVSFVYYTSNLNVI